MKPDVPTVTVYERDGMFFPQTSLTVGGYIVAGHKTKKLAECAALNLQYAYLQGWTAREKAFRKQLDLTD